MSSGDGWTIRALLRPHLRTIVFITVLQIIGVVAQAIAIIMLKPILNNGIYEGDFSKLALFGCYLIISTLILSLVLFVTTNLASKVATSVAEELRGRLVEAAVKSNNINALGIVPSEAMVCLTNDVSSVQRFVFETLRTYLPMPILLGILIVYTFNTNAILGTILFLTMAFVGSFTYIFTKRLQPLYKKQVETMSNVNASLREKIPGARTIRAYDGYDYEEKKFGDYSAQFGSMNRKVVLNSYYVSSLVTACMWIFIVFTFVASALDEGNKLIATDIIIFMQVATYIIATLALIPYAYVGVPRMRECFSHLKSVVTNAQSMERTYGESEADEDGGIIFSAKDVHLKSRHGRTIFDGIDLEIDRGKTVSIVGPNGNNSSELFKMALGFTIPDSGKLKVFGMDVSSTDPDLLRGRISYVNNSMHIFRGTLRYNLDPKGNHSDQEILSVCDRIGLGRFIAEMPDGLDSMLYDNVSRTSGGQRLLILMVRGLLRASDLYIFDDCFFSLDKKTKGMALATISEMCAGKTVVFLMHDTSTCEVSDSIILMQQGKVVGQGTHSELLESSDLYGNLYRIGQGRNGSWA